MLDDKIGVLTTFKAATYLPEVVVTAVALDCSDYAGAMCGEVLISGVFHFRPLAGGDSTFDRFEPSLAFGHPW